MFNRNEKTERKIKSRNTETIFRVRLSYLTHSITHIPRAPLPDI